MRFKMFPRQASDTRRKGREVEQRLEISNLKSEISDPKCHISNAKFQISNAKFQISNLKFQIWNFKSQISNSESQISNFKSPIRARQFPLLCAHLALCVLLCLAPAARAADDSPGVDAAVNRGLEYLVSQQQKDGSIGSGTAHVAASGLTLLALLGNGNTPDVGPDGAVVRQLVDYLVGVAPADGYFGKVDGSRMYGQGIVTLALAEALGVETTQARRDRLVAALQRAVKVILAAQAVAKPAAFAGGWRYEPTSADSDLSQAAWNAMALRACEDAGLAVPKEAVTRAGQFILRCYRPDQKGFAYQPGQGASMCESAVGIFCMHELGVAGRGEADDAMKSLLAGLPTSKPADAPFPYYTLFYLTQAANQSGRPAWEAVWPITSESLLHLQEPAGSWPMSPKELADDHSGRIYTTAMAVLTLSVPNRLLPMDQGGAGR